MRLVCSTASFPEDRLEIAIAKVAWAGYKGVEIALAAPELPDEEAVRRRIHADELVPAAVHAGSLPAGTGEEGLQELAFVGRAAALARSLDGSIVVAEAPTAGTVTGLLTSLRRLDAALGGLGVEICLANRRGTLLESREALSELFGSGGRPCLPERIGLTLDPGQALLAGWDPVDLEALPQLPRHVYLNDAGGGRIVPPGEGVLDLPCLGAALREWGYSGSVSLRLENADPWAVEPLARELSVAAAGWFM